jgi:putative FmdB family regulatory protein
MPLYDFKCRDCGVISEHLTRFDVKETSCPRCQGNADRQVCAPKIDHTALAMGDSATAGGIDKWDRARRKKMAIEERKLRDHGTYV